MIQSSFLFVVMMGALLIEFYFASFGVILPLCAVSIFYITITYGWNIGFLLACFGGLAIDFLFGRTVIISPFTIAAIAGMALVWIRQTEPKSLLFHLLPGIVAAMIYLFPVFLVNQYASGVSWRSLTYDMPGVLFGIMISALLLPAVIVGLDYLSFMLGLELYSDAKEKLIESRRFSK